MAIVQECDKTTYADEKPIASIVISGTKAVETLDFTAFNGALTDISGNLVLSAELPDIGVYKIITWSNGAKSESITFTPTASGISEFSFTVDDGVSVFTSEPFLISADRKPIPVNLVKIRFLGSKQWH